MRDHKAPLILLALNEINFDVVSEYLKHGSYPSFRKLMTGKFITTSSEAEYEYLEPWIQWPSIYNGQVASAHRLFRLGDSVDSSVPQLFESLENQGLKVGCISPMNAANRMENPLYFIPDPWTQTASDTSWWSRLITQVVSQAVNDNAQQKLTVRSACALLLIFLRFAKLRRYARYLKLAFCSWRAPWRKALFLDLLLHDVHLALFSRRRPDFSTLFMNAGAHIQHHYLFNSLAKNDAKLANPEWYISSRVDPFREMLDIYDHILEDVVDQQSFEYIVATGLSQVPYDHMQCYYRLKNHAEFLCLVGIKNFAVFPRMTRDFLIEFDSTADALAAQDLLSSVRTSDESVPIFAEIDNRGTSLFVTLTYSAKITSQSSIVVSDTRLPLLQHVVFVAIKNGMHVGRGFAAYSTGTRDFAPTSGAHVASIHGAILAYFEA